MGSMKETICIHIQNLNMNCKVHHFPSWSSSTHSFRGRSNMKTMWSLINFAGYETNWLRIFWIFNFLQNYIVTVRWWEMMKKDSVQKAVCTVLRTKSFFSSSSDGDGAVAAVTENNNNFTWHDTVQRLIRFKTLLNLSVQRKSSFYFIAAAATVFVASFYSLAFSSLIYLLAHLLACSFNSITHYFSCRKSCKEIAMSFDEHTYTHIHIWVS